MKKVQFLKRSLNKGIMQQILDCFVELTGIRAAYYDESRESVTGRNKNMCGFCTMLREYPGFYNGCIKSDRAAFKMAEELKNFYLYRCHMGLYEAVAPIFINRHLAGILMLGQVKSEEQDGSHWDEIEEKLVFLNIPPEKFEALRQAYDEIQAMSSEKIEASAKMLDIIAQYIVGADVIHLYDMEAVEKAQQYIRQYFKERISNETIASAAGLSSSYLSSLFRRETGYTITGYIEMLRIKTAKELLTLTPLSIKEISAMCGYEDQNYFSRIFKKCEKISPVSYREENKK